MSRYPYYKRYQEDALRGMSRLTLEQRGAYNTILDLLYENGGPIVDDDAYLARQMNCSLRKWRTVKAELVVLGKIYVAVGLISNGRAMTEIDKQERLHHDLVEAGSRGGKARARQHVRAAIEDRSDPVRKAVRGSAHKAKKGANTRQSPHLKTPISASKISRNLSETASRSNENNYIDQARPVFEVKQPESRVQIESSLVAQSSAEPSPPSPLIGGGEGPSSQPVRSADEVLAELRRNAAEEAERSGKPAAPVIPITDAKRKAGGS